MKWWQRPRYTLHCLFFSGQASAKTVFSLQEGRCMIMSRSQGSFTWDHRWNEILKESRTVLAWIFWIISFSLKSLNKIFCCFWHSHFGTSNAIKKLDNLTSCLHAWKKPTQMHYQICHVWEDLIFTIPTEYSTHKTAIPLQYISIAISPSVRALDFLLVEQSSVFVHDLLPIFPFQKCVLGSSSQCHTSVCNWDHPSWGPLAFVHVHLQ